MKKTKLVKNQKKLFSYKLEKNHVIEYIEVTVRYDNHCSNGYNSFSITTQNGCDHNKIAEKVPELAHLIKWHFMTSKGPMHYFSNTMYHANELDYNGELKGEFTRYKINVMANIANNNSFIRVYSSAFMYENRQKSINLELSNKKQLKLLEEFCSVLTVQYKQVKINDFNSMSEGKESDLKAARSCAIWPDANLYQLRDRNLLEKRLPKLKEDFIKDIESDLLGFIF